jgi:hypothetical protein
MAALAGLLGLPLAAGAVAEQEPAAERAGSGPVAQPPVVPAAPGPDARVARSAFTTAVVDREPQDALEQLESDVRSVSYFTELRGLEGETVTHRWEFAGEVMSEVSFQVAGPRWRVHSTKRLDPMRLGEWTVSVLDGQGRTLSRESLRYVAAGGAGVPSVSADE